MPCYNPQEFATNKEGVYHEQAHKHSVYPGVSFAADKLLIIHTTRGAHIISNVGPTSDTQPDRADPNLYTRASSRSNPQFQTYLHYHDGK